MAEIPGDVWDYTEVVYVYCKVDGCSWTKEISWGEVEEGGVEAIYRPHWEQKHG